jgi:PAS domain S-box-containing protein
MNDMSPTDASAASAAIAALQEENQCLRAERDEAQEALRAIREGEVDAIVVAGKDGEQVFSLSGAESVYRLIVQTMQEAALTVTPDGTILSCNPQFEALIHFESGWVIGRPLETFVAPEERGSLAALLARSQLESVRQRLVFQTTDGTPVPAHVSAHVFQQPDGPSICLVATDLSALESSMEIVRRLREEVTARQASEAALRQSEGKFAIAFRTSPIGITLSTLAEGRYLDVNAAFLQMVGYSREELLGQTSTAMRVWLDAEARHRTFAELQATGTIGEREVVFRRKSGELFSCLFSCELVEIAGQPVALTNMLEITKRKQAEAALQASEAEFRAFFETAAVGTAQLGPDGRFLAVNARLCEITGYTPEELLKLTPAELVPPEDRAGDLAGLAAYLRGDASRCDVEKRWLHKDGRVIWVHMTAAPIRDAAGRFLRSAGIIQDITARKQADAVLQHAHAQLEQRVEERTIDLAKALAKQAIQSEQLRALTGELSLAEQRERQRLAQVLHDGLQQFLVAARMRTQLLSRSQGSELEVACKEVYALLDDAIKSSRALTAELSPPILHTAGFVPALEWLAKWMTDTHDLMVTLDADPALQVESETIKVLVFQSVRELLFNVVKHAGVPQATVNVYQQDGHLRIIVADQGRGFRPDRVVSSATGLGLASIRQRLEFLGGEIDMSSTPGQGSRFTLSVPLR